MSTTVKELRKAIREIIKEEISRMTTGRYSTQGAGIESDVPTFFVVTKPTPDSTVNDIVFEVDPVSFANQIRGGLKEQDIALLTTNEGKAMRLANKLLGKETLDAPTDSVSNFYKRTRLFMRERKKK